MNVRICPSVLSGEVTLPSSKSVAHRALIAAALAKTPCLLRGRFVGDDVAYTTDCLNRLGAKIAPAQDALMVEPIAVPAKKADLYVGASGSTLRFMLPVSAALGTETSFSGTERLSSRPIGELLNELCRHGIRASSDRLPLSISGQLVGRDYAIDAEVSSQYITGLMLALGAMGGGVIRPIGRVVSKNYLDITAQVMRAFSVEASIGDVIEIKGNYSAPQEFAVESDWSSAAFFGVSGAIGGKVALRGLNPDSTQGDKALIDCLILSGANVERTSGGYTVSPGERRAFTFDVENCPDAAPALAVLAAFCPGKSVLTGTSRLKIKESDRAAETVKFLSEFGIRAVDQGNALVIEGGTPHGGKVKLPDDHRIAMSAAIIAAYATGESELFGAECVNKSYPIFFDDYVKLGGKADVFTV